MHFSLHRNVRSMIFFLLYNLQHKSMKFLLDLTKPDRIPAHLHTLQHTHKNSIAALTKRSREVIIISLKSEVGQNSSEKFPPTFLTLSICECCNVINKTPKTLKTVITNGAIPNRSFRNKKDANFTKIARLNIIAATSPTERYLSA